MLKWKTTKKWNRRGRETKQIILGTGGNGSQSVYYFGLPFDTSRFRIGKGNFRYLSTNMWGLNNHLCDSNVMRLVYTSEDSESRYS